MGIFCTRHVIAKNLYCAKTLPGKNSLTQLFTQVKYYCTISMSWNACVICKEKYHIQEK